MYRYYYNRSGDKSVLQIALIIFVSFYAYIYTLRLSIHCVVKPHKIYVLASKLIYVIETSHN